MKKHHANLAACLLLAAVTVAAFWQVRRHQFINYDDGCYVTENHIVQEGVTWEGLQWAFFRLQGEDTYWHPLTWVSHMVDCQIFGLNSAGHHLVNLFFHLLNVVLVFLVFQRMTKAFWRSALLAALFALHPLQVDTVAWVAERKNLLSAAFWLLTMWAYVRYAEGRMQRAECRIQSSEFRSYHHASRFTFHASRYYFLVLLFFALGLMCKPVLVTLPFVLLLLDYWPLRRLQLTGLKPPAAAFARLVWEKAPLFLLAGGSCLITIAAHRNLGALSDAFRVPPSLRVANALVSYVRYLGKAVCPVNLAILYPYPRPWPGWKVAFCGLLLLGVSGLAIRMVRSRPHLFVGWFWFLGVLVPFIGLIQAGEQAMADRFMYIPILGLLLLVVWGVDALVDTWPHKRRWLALAGSLAICACLVRTDSQLGYWQNGETLFRHALEVTSRNYTACDRLANALDAAGKREEALVCFAESVRLAPRQPEAQCDLGTLWLKMGRLDEAVQHLTAAVKNDPAYAPARVNLGKALLEQGKRQEALACFAESVRVKPGDPQGQYNYGTLLLKMGRVEDAVQPLTAAVKNDPAFANAHINLGKARLEQGRLEEAAVHLSKAVRLTPGDPEAHYSLGTLLLKQGKAEQAIACFSEALRLKPDYGEAHSNLGVLLMRQGKLGEGASHLAAAARLNPNNPEAQYNLGLALLELNQPRQAAEQFTAALRLNPDAPGPQFHLALALVRQDKLKEALPQAQKARDLAVAAGQSALAAKAEDLLKQYP